MRIIRNAATALVLSLTLSGAANAVIIGVLTESSAMATVFRPDENGNPRIVNFEGAQISESYGNVGLGSAARFDATAQVGVNVVEFQHGNAAFGEGVISQSRTAIDIAFRNTTGRTLRPALNSQITPAGLGLYVSGCPADDLRECGLRDDGDYDWQDVGERVAPGDPAVGTRFDFKVVSGEEVLFELSGGISLVLGENRAPNTIVRDLSRVENVLTDFRQTSPPGNQQQISFDWGVTDFLVEFPGALTLAPGEVSTVSYISEVTTFSNAFCFDAGRQACPIAYGAFGDPIGRGGAAGQRPSTSVSQFFAPGVLAAHGINGLEFGTYRFNYPTFENGQINFRLISGPGIGGQAQVSEPAPLALLGLGVSGLMLIRRYRQTKVKYGLDKQ